MKPFLASLAFGIAITTNAVAADYLLMPPLFDEGRFAPLVSEHPEIAGGPTVRTPRLRWGAGIRTQSVFAQDQNLPWVELGGDVVVYPWKHLGLGVTGLMGAQMMGSACETQSEDACAANWRAVTPFIEYRFLPDYWLSPYARQSLGVAWGNFSNFGTAPNSTALVSRVELGLDLHRGASLRPYLAAERLDGPLVSRGGFGGGVQVGLSI